MHIISQLLANTVIYMCLVNHLDGYWLWLPYTAHFCQPFKIWIHLTKVTSPQFSNLAHLSHSHNEQISWFWPSRLGPPLLLLIFLSRNYCCQQPRSMQVLSWCSHKHANSTITENLILAFCCDQRTEGPAQDSSCKISNETIAGIDTFYVLLYPMLSL